MVDLGRADVTITEDTLRTLGAHTWPGNVRELKNALARALAFVDDAVLQPRHLRLIQPPSDHALLDGLPLGGYPLDGIERVAIKQTVLQAGGNKLRAARTLGIAPSTLYEKLKKYSL